MEEALAFFRCFSSDPPIAFSAAQTKAHPFSSAILQSDPAQRTRFAALLLNDLLSAQPLLYRSISLEHVHLYLYNFGFYLTFDAELLRLSLFFHPGTGYACYHLAVQRIELLTAPFSCLIDAAALRQALKKR